MHRMVKAVGGLDELDVVEQAVIDLCLGRQSWSEYRALVVW